MSASRPLFRPTGLQKIGEPCIALDDIDQTKIFAIVPLAGQSNLARRSL
jgi:hypothetical protein